jgi:hypothetical protein
MCAKVHTMGRKLVNDPHPIRPLLVAILGGVCLAVLIGAGVLVVLALAS